MNDFYWITKRTDGHLEVTDRKPKLCADEESLRFASSTTVRSMIDSLNWSHDQVVDELKAELKAAQDERKTHVLTLLRVYEFVASNSLAASYQTTGQYRTELMKLLKSNPK